MLDAPPPASSGFTNARLEAYARDLRTKYSPEGKVLLVQTPQFLFDSFNVDIAKRRGYYAYPPTGLQWLAKSLAGRGLNIDILDLNLELLKRVNSDPDFDYHNWLDILEEWLEAKKPSIVGVTSINIYADAFAPSYPLTSVLDYLKEKDKYIILAGGPIATNERRNYLTGGYCHFVACGEGENKIQMIFDYLFDIRPFQINVTNIFFKYEGTVVETEGLYDVVTLSGNLIDTYHAVPIEEYNKIGSLNPYSRMAGQEKKYSVFQLFRGCRANCQFCGVRDFMGKGTRHFPVQDVLDEMLYLVEKRNVLHFDVIDDDFLKNTGVVKELLHGLAAFRKKYDITWSSNNGLIGASLTDELMGLMCESGCVGFRIGVESGNQEMLRKMKKPATLATLRESAAIMNRFPQAFTGANYIIGILGEETFGNMLDTYKFALELDLDWASFAVFQFTHNDPSGSAPVKSDRKTTTDFVPSKSSSDRVIGESEGILSGLDIFKIAKDQVPSGEQVKQIWFAFNLLINFVGNKNLKDDGNPGKFTRWLEAVKIPYPQNPYMCLFAGLGRMLTGQRELALAHIRDTKSILAESEYWRQRFAQFDLTGMVDQFPVDAAETRVRLADLREALMGKAVF